MVSVTGRLWPEMYLELVIAIAGGVITYMAGGAQRVAVATGLANVTLPTEVATAKIIVLGLDGETAKP